MSVDGPVIPEHHHERLRTNLRASLEGWGFCAAWSIAPTFEARQYNFWQISDRQQAAKPLFLSMFRATEAALCLPEQIYEWRSTQVAGKRCQARPKKQRAL
jgi:hypothetical protein